MLKNSKSSIGRTARRLMFMTGVASAVLHAGAAGAQTADADASASEEIVVTGTQIRGVAPVGSSLIEIDRKTIEASGALTTNEILKLQPQVFDVGISALSRGSTGGSQNPTYGTSVNLRGLSPFATLTLVDSHRTVPAGVMGQAPDTQYFPSIMLQRVDVVADGASATYGSDAIAGVVNMIWRRNYEGAQVSARGGWGDGWSENQASVLFGRRWETGQVTFGAEAVHNSALKVEDLEFYRGDLRPFGGTDFRTLNCNPPNIVVSGVSYAVPAGGVTPATAGSLVAGTQNRCDLPFVSDLVPEQDRYAAALTFDQEITPWLKFTGDAYYATRFFDRKVPITAATINLPSTNPYYVAPPGSTPPACSAANPAVRCVSVQYWLGGQALGNTWNEHGWGRSYQGTGAFDFTLPHEWRLKLQGTYGQNTESDRVNNVSFAAGSPGAAALASSNPATALNPFGQNSAQLLQSIVVGGVSPMGWVYMRNATATADGPIFTLPAGEVRVALGLEHSLLKQHSSITGLDPLPRIAYTRQKFNAEFGEIFVPVIGPEMGVPGVRSLDLDVGIRHTKYEPEAESTNPKVGVNWGVVEDFKVHASYGTSFRAPGLIQGPGTNPRLFSQNFFTSAGTVQAYTYSGDNGPLNPETANTYSLGFDWQPSYVPGLKVNINHFWIKYTNQIANYISNLAVLGNPDKFAGIITWCTGPRATPATLAACQAFGARYTTIQGTVLGPIGSPTGPVAFVDGRNQNLGTTYADGIDYDIRYSIPDTSIGSFNFAAGGTYFTRYDTTLTPGGAISDDLNKIGKPIDFKVRLMGNWTNDGWSATTFVTHYNSYTNDLVTPNEEVDSYTSVDLNLQYTFSGDSFVKGLRTGVNVRNLFDREPPFANVAPGLNGGGYDPQGGANPIGRITSVFIEKTF